MIPGGGTKILHAVQCGQKKKNNKVTLKELVQGGDGVGVRVGYIEVLQ